MRAGKMLLAAGAAWAVAASAAAQFAIPWHTIDGGGGTSLGGSFELSGTIGQPDAGVMSGGSFTLEGGFWSGITGSAFCAGDADGDLDIDLDDLLLVLGSFGDAGPNSPGDTDGDGDTDLDDLLLVLGAFGSSC